DANTSLLENLVAITLLRKYGREESVFFYNKNIEVDFYIPDAEIAIQACYNLNHNTSTYDREVNALVKLQNVLPCKRLIIITKEESQTINIGNTTIEVIPIHHWLLYDKMLNGSY
ncbi:MAG: ATP-binding protein, partial [bacterium]